MNTPNEAMAVLESTDSQVYRLYWSWGTVVIMWVMPIFATMPFVVCLVLGLTFPDGEIFLFIAVPLFLGYAAWMWYRALSIVRRIIVRPNESIEFVTGLRHLIVPPQDIISIRPEGGQIGFLIIRYRQGRVRLFNQLNGFNEFLSHLRSRNPGVDLYGC